MGLFGNFRLAPGLRLSTSSRGLRVHAGPRLARLHFGGGRTGASTGAGPFTWYESVSPSSNVSPKPVDTSGMTPAQAAKARQVADVSLAWERLHGQHRLEFPEARAPGTVAAEPVPMFGVLLRESELFALARVGRLDRTARREGRRVARADAEARALELLERGLSDRQARQQQADAQWAALIAGEPAATEGAIAAALESRGVQVVVQSLSESAVRMVLQLPGDDVVPSHEPSVTPGGAPTLKKITKTQVAAVVREVAAGRVLLAAKEVYAVSPATQVIQVEGGFGHGPVVMRAIVTREACKGADWSTPAWAVLTSIDPRLEVNVGGRTQELRPLN